ncbi:MAG: hypothetical protein ACHP9T_16395 [Caulobacterales bacterium]
MKALLSGAAAAAVAGVMLGAAMQPHLDADGRPAGPQMFANWTGDRSTGPFDPGTTFVSYHGKVPDYVLGTDWKKATAWPDERAAVSPPARAVSAEVADAATAPTAETPALTPVVYDEPPPPTHAYPSMGGDHPSVIEVPAPAPDATTPATSG